MYYLNKLKYKQNLLIDESKNLLLELISGHLSETEITEILLAWNQKEITTDELIGAVQAMRAKARPIFIPKLNLIDTCGTGGDKSNTFNISTLAAIICASAGIPVAKHGNRAASSQCGSADILEALGLKIDLPPEKVVTCIEKTNFGFLFAPIFHPAMKNVAEIRKKLGVKTIFNLLGPLSHPAHIKRQIIGVYDQKLIDLYGNALAYFQPEHALIVHGSGLDEIALHGKTTVLEIKNKLLKKYDIEPTSYNLKNATLDEVQGGSRLENLQIVNDILSKKKSPKRDIVILNTAAAIYISGKVKSIEEGVEVANNAIDSGFALKKLQEIIETTNQLA